MSVNEQIAKAADRGDWDCEHEWVLERCQSDEVLVCRKCGMDKWRWFLSVRSQCPECWKRFTGRDDWVRCRCEGMREVVIDLLRDFLNFAGGEEGLPDRFALTSTYDDAEIQDNELEGLISSFNISRCL